MYIGGNTATGGLMMYIGGNTGAGALMMYIGGNTAAGGLMMALPREQAAAFCKDIEKQEGYQAWIIGIVEKGSRTARIIDKPRVIEVPAKDKEGELW